jgi:hypothetical protein
MHVGQQVAAVKVNCHDPAKDGVAADMGWSAMAISPQTMDTAKILFDINSLHCNCKWTGSRVRRFFRARRTRARDSFLVRTFWGTLLIRLAKTMKPTS